MKSKRQEEPQKIRRTAPESLLVYDLKTGTILGRIVDMSARGMKLVGDHPIEVRHIYYGRIPLKKKIDGCEEIFLDAECRWCRKADEAGKFICGFFLRYSSQRDAALVQKIMYSWMASQSQKQNARYMVPAK